jgi:hypothetical protein
MEARFQLARDLPREPLVMWFKPLEGMKPERNPKSGAIVVPTWLLALLRLGEPKGSHSPDSREDQTKCTDEDAKSRNKGSNKYVICTCSARNSMTVTNACATSCTPAIGAICLVFGAKATTYSTLGSKVLSSCR